MNRTELLPRIALLAVGTSLAGVALAAGPMRSAMSPVVAPVMLVAADDDNDKADDGRDGKYASDEVHARDIRWLLADVVDRAAKDDGYKRVPDWLSSKDRHRIADNLDKVDAKGYAAAARAFRETWHDKFGGEFNAHKNRDDITSVQVKFQDIKNRKFATVTFPAYGGMDKFDMRLQLEAKQKWRIEVPNDVDAKQFVSELEDNLRRIANNKSGLTNDEENGLNSAISQILHGLGFEEGKETKAKKK